MKVKELLFEGKTDYVVKTFGEKLVNACRSNDHDFFKQIAKGLDRKLADADTQAILAGKIIENLLKVDPKEEERAGWLEQKAELEAEVAKLRKLSAAHTDNTRVNTAATELATKERELNRLNGKLANPSDKYLVWIARMYASGQFKMEDVPRIRQEIITFEKHKNEMQNKDLNSYKTLTDLYAATDKFAEKKDVEVKDEDKDDKDVEWLIRTPYFKALIPKSVAASCKYGSGTRWCTAATDSHNYFDHYNKQGDLVIIIAKIGNAENEFKYGPQEGTWRKFQFHFDTHSFMDEQDTPKRKGSPEIKGLSKHPEYLQFLHMMIDKHLGKD
jgi:hypothetical protein